LSSSNVDLCASNSLKLMEYFFRVPNKKNKCCIYKSGNTSKYNNSGRYQEQQ